MEMHTCVLGREEERERESAYPDGHSGQGSVINLLTSPAQPPEESPVTLLGFAQF